MTRGKLRIILLAIFLLAAAFASWSWLRPYAWDADPKARCKVVGVLVKRDHSNFWLDAHLKILPDQTHDLLQPVRLKTASGREIEPADTTLAGDKNRPTTDLWFKFWLERSDLEGPLTLQINQGTLLIKADSEIPNLGSAESKYFTTQHW